MTLPTFLVIGAAKSGTTSLHHYLGQHPEIFMSPVKEPGFFAFEGENLEFNGPGDDWISKTVSTSLSQYASNFQNVRSEKAIGESSPVYLYSSRAAGRIKRHLEAPRLIAILRNPVERAFSQFLFFVQCGREPLRDFEAALSEEDHRIEKNWAWGWHYRRVGFYHRQLTRYFEVFDRSQISVYLYEDLRDRPVETLQSIFEFVGVDPDFEPDVSRRLNVTEPPRPKILDDLIRKPSVARSIFRAVTTVGLRRRIAGSRALTGFAEKPDVPPKAAAGLLKVYRPDIEKLQALLDRDLSSWLQ